MTEDVDLALRSLLGDSERLYLDIERVANLIERPPLTARRSIVARLCVVAWEHGAALRALATIGLSISSTALLRMQFEAMVRGAWAFHAASDEAIAKLDAALTPENEKKAKGIPLLADMLTSIEKHAHAGVGVALRDFYNILGPGMNAFVHAGLHPVRVAAQRFPTATMEQVLRTSNGLAMYTLLSYAEMCEADARFLEGYEILSAAYAHVLPDLHESAGSSESRK